MIFNHLLNLIHSTKYFHSYSVKKTTRGIALLIALTMLFSLAASAATAPSSNNPENAEQNNSRTGIDYSDANVIVTGTIDGNDNGAYYINLTKETLTVPSDYTIKAYSVNGGSSWSAVSTKATFDSAAMVKLFTKDVTLAFTDKYDSKARKPAKDATIVNFAKINKRPTLKTYAVNYLIGADPSGETPGTWVLTLSGKNGTTSVKEGFEVAVADSAGKAPDSNGYGRFFGKDGTANGISIVPLPENNKPVQSSYFIRQAAKDNGDGTYTLASTSRKITVKGQQKPPTYKVDNKKKIISYGANTYVCINNTDTELKIKKGECDVSAGGDIYLWEAATASEPASAIQKTTVTPGDKIISFMSATIQTISSIAVFTDAKGNKTKKGIYTKGSKKPFTLTVYKDFDSFKDLTINGRTLIRDTDYTVKSGSTIITLSENYLGTLNTGDYQLSANFDDVSIESNLSVTPVGGNIYDEINGLLDEVERIYGKSTRDMYAADLSYFESYDGGLEEMRGYLQSAVSNQFGNVGIMALASYVIAFASDGNNQTINGVTATGSVTQPISPIQAEGDPVQITVTFSGLPSANGTHTVKLSSTTLGAAGISPNDHTFSVIAGQSVSSRTFTFVMPSSAVNDLKIEHTAIIPVANVTLNTNTASFVLGFGSQTLQLTQTIQPTNASNKAITWTSSNDNVATVSNSGLITINPLLTAADLPATATITVTTTNGGHTATCAVTVTAPIPVNSISLSPNEKSIQIGSSSEAPVVIFNPTNASNKTVTWTSSDVTVATVNATTGQITSVGAGSATIKATTVDGGKTATCLLFVKSATPDFAITTTTLPNGMRGRAYSALQLTTNRPSEHVTWNPYTDNGLTISSSGILSGIPVNATTMSLTVTATYRENGTGTAETNSTTLTLIISPTYEVTIAVLGGVGGSVWAVSDGDGERSAITKTDTGVKFYVPYTNPNVTLTAMPDATYQVKQWIPNIGTITTDKTELKRSLTGDLQVTVEFEKSPNYRIEFYAVDTKGTVIGMVDNVNPITAKIVGGSSDITSPATAEEGNVIEFTANLPGYSVTKWEGKVTNAGSGSTNTNPEGLFNTLNASTGSTTRLNLLKVSNLGITTTPADQVKITVNVMYEPSPPVITTTTLPDGAIGVAYSQTLTATTTLSNPGITWKLTAGSLPPGFTLNTNTGVISGTPTVGQGTAYTFTVVATDKRNTSSAVKELSIKIPGQYKITFEVVNNLGGTIKAEVYNGAVREGEISSGALVNDGRDIVFTLTPDTASGYRVDKWDVSVPSTSPSYTPPNPDNTSNTYRVTKITDAIEVKVTFARTKEYSVDFGIDSGRGRIEATRVDTGNAIQPGSYVPLGTEIAFKATPNPGYRVTQWKWEVTTAGTVTNSDTIGTNAEQYNLKITGNTEINITFAPIYNVTSFSLNKTATTIPGKGSETLIPVLTPASIPPEIVEWSAGNFVTAPGTGEYNLTGGSYVFVGSGNGNYNFVASTSCATVNEDGVVSGLSAGTVTIMAAVPGLDKRSTCTVTVTPVSVLRINNVPDTAITGIPLELTGVIDPVFALLANQPANAKIAIEWSIPKNAANTADLNNTAGAIILADSNILTTTKAGSITIRATIREFVETTPGVFEQTGSVHFRTGTQQEVNDVTNAVNAAVKQLDFTITVRDFIPVNKNGITLTTTPATVTAKLPTVLTGTVAPSNASYKTIVWSIDRDNTTTGSDTKITDGNVLTAENEGTVRLVATIANGAEMGKNYTQTFDIKVNPIVGTFISLNKTTMTINMGVTDSSLIATVVSNTTTDKSVLWSSSNEKVAAVDHTGKITATGAGTAVITVKTADGSNKTATCTVTVPANTQKPTITTLSVPNGTADIIYSTTLAATGAVPIKWSVSSGNLPNDLVLNPDTGVITGVPRIPGTYTFTVSATNGAGSESRNLTVKITEPIPVAGITLHAEATTLIIGNSATLRANIIPTNATDKALIWSTSNAGVANVNTDGTITGTGEGKATITARTADGSNRTATCEVTVIYPPVNGVVLNKSSTSIPIGSSETLVATVYPTNAKNRTVTWSTSSTTIATVKDGAVIAVAAGTATITAKTAEGGYIATCVVTVTIPVTGVTLNKASLTILHGEKDTLIANVVPANATNKTVSWSTSDRTVVTVDSSGVITAVAPGKATVTVTTADGGKTAICTVTVNPVPVTGVTLNKNTTRIPIGDSEALAATIAPSNATNKGITWTSSNTAVATVDANGRVTGRAEGTAIITATTTEGKFTATCSVTVHTVAVAGITVKTSVTIGVGASEALTHSLIPANATNKNVSWTSSNTSVAVVDSTGRVTGRKEGNATVTVTTAEGGFTATCVVRVTALIPVTGVTLNKTSMTLVQGAAETLTATVNPSNAANKDVSWSSSNTNVATVDSVGRVTARASGTSTITVRTADGGRTATCTVNVEGVYSITIVQAAGGTASASHTSARTGTSITLSASIVNDGYYVTWSISPPNVIVTGNSFIMPNSDVTITPVYQRIALIDTYTDPAEINTSNTSSYNLSLTQSVSIPASTLANLSRQNSGFAIDAQTSYGTYQVPVNLASIIPDMNSTLSKNNVGINDVTFNIILNDKTSDRGVIDALAKEMPQSKIISAVEFTAEIAKLSANANAVGKTLDTISNFTQRVTRLIPMPSNMVTMPDNWGVFRYNETLKRFEFVPHTMETIDGVLYAVVQSASNGIYIVAENTVIFGDVAPDEWYTHYVEKAAAKKLVQGVGSSNFAPDRNVTRAEFVQMINNALQLPQASSATKGYSDVPAAEWYYDTIMRAKSAGLLDRFTGSNFEPDRSITREEMAVILAAAARREKLSPTSSSAVSLSGIFTDYSQINSNYVSDIELVYRLSIMQGTGGGVFNPRGTTTRAEAATVQIRLLELLGFID